MDLVVYADVEPREVNITRTRLAFLLNLLAHLDLVLLDFRQRYDLLDVDKYVAVETIRLQPNTSDVDVVVQEPEYGRCQFSGKLRCGKDNADVLRELIFIRVFPSQKVEN